VTQLRRYSPLTDKKHRFILSINRELFDEGILRLYYSMINLCDLRVYFEENEGGFSNSISGQAIIEGISRQTGLHRKRINFKVTHKGLDFFETMTNI